MCSVSVLETRRTALLGLMGSEPTGTGTPSSLLCFASCRASGIVPHVRECRVFLSKKAGDYTVEQSLSDLVNKVLLEHGHSCWFCADVMLPREN